MTHELMTQMKDNINIGTDPGIGIEMKDFFRGCEDVETYNISVSENMIYKIQVKLKTFSLIESKKVFSAFLRFVEYPGGSFYLRKSNNEVTTYSLLTFKENMKGFYCELEFK
ncbi:MAG: hypothetical protein AAGU75_10655 [Bacillota bacterium]